MQIKKYLKCTAIAVTMSGILFATPILGQAVLGEQVLKDGMTHEDIKILQEHLIHLNYLELDNTTTYYGEQTTNAIKEFQKSQGLKADGIFGPDTYKALTKVMEIEPLKYNGILKEGMNSEDVKKLQKSLKFLGFLDIDECTTYFGQETKQALMDFQKIHNLKVDGIAGAETIRILNEALSGNKHRNKIASANRGSLSNQSLGQDIISTAKKYIGTPHSSRNSNGFDCSGFTSHVYKQHGINISRSSAGQASDGEYVSKDNLEIGDLVIFNGTYKSGPSHTGIYIGDGKFIHTSSSKGVMISDLNSDSYWSKRFYCGRRVL